MAIQPVQTAQKSTTGVASITTPAIATTSGNLIVLAGAADPGANFSKFSDSLNNAWAKSPSSPQTYTGSRTSHQWYALNIIGGAAHTFTLTATATTDLSMFATEIAGIDPFNPLNVSTGAVQTATTAVSTGPTVNRSTTNEILVASFFTTFVGIISVTPTSGFTIPANGTILTSAQGAPGAIGYRVTTTDGNDAGAFTIGASADMGSILTSFRGIQFKRPFFRA